MKPELPEIIVVEISDDELKREIAHSAAHVFPKFPPAADFFIAASIPRLSTIVANKEEVKVIEEAKFNIKELKIPSLQVFSPPMTRRETQRKRT